MRGKEKKTQRIVIEHKTLARGKARFWMLKEACREYPFQKRSLGESCARGDKKRVGDKASVEKKGSWLSSCSGNLRKEPGIRRQVKIKTQTGAGEAW